MAERLDVDFGVWGTIKKVAVAIIVITILLGLSFLYIPIIKQSRSLEKEIEIKREVLYKQQQLQQTYRDQINALHSDPEAVEAEARKKLNLIKPKEIIYHFEGLKEK